MHCNVHLELFSFNLFFHVYLFFSYANDRQRGWNRGEAMKSNTAVKYCFTAFRNFEFSIAVHTTLLTRGWGCHMEVFFIFRLFTQLEKPVSNLEIAYLYILLHPSPCIVILYCCAIFSWCYGRHLPMHVVTPICRCINHFYYWFWFY